MGFIYFISLDDKYVKIGYSRHPYRRFFEIRAYNPNSLHLLGMMEGTIAGERKLHRLFRRRRVSNEWFVYDKEIESFIGENCELPDFWDLKEEHWPTLSLNQFRQNWRRSFHCVQNEKQRLVLQKRGMPVAALIPIEDLRYLEELEGASRRSSQAIG